MLFGVVCVSVSVYLVEPSPRQIDPLAFKREKGSEWIEQLPVVVVVLPLLYRTVRIMSVVLRIILRGVVHNIIPPPLIGGGGYVRYVPVFHRI